MTEHEALFDLEPALVWMQVGATNRSAVDPEENIRRLLDGRLRNLLQPNVMGAEIGEPFHPRAILSPFNLRGHDPLRA
jgi:hypothetical protein